MYHRDMRAIFASLLFVLHLAGCGDDDGAGAGATDGGPGVDSHRPPPPGEDAMVPPPPPTCAPAAAGGSTDVAAPTLIAMLGDRWHEAWLGSPALADLDADGTPEILAARGDLVLGWHLDGSVVFRTQVEGDGRIWASPIVADLAPSRPGLEVAAAS